MSLITAYFASNLILMIFAYSPKVIIDTDIGTDFDDQVAISYALSLGDQFDIQLILTATFNTTGRAQLLAKYLDYVDRSDIDIGIGLPTPSQRYEGVGFQMHWADDYDINSYPGPGTIYQDGVSRAAEIIEEQGTAADPVYVIAIAPLTNLGAMLTTNPSLKSKMRIITMGGSIYKGYSTDYPAAEYNVWQDTPASQVVYNHTDDIPYANNICAAPLDTTDFFQIYGDNYQKLLATDNLITKIMIENYIVWYENGGHDFDAYRSFTPKNATSCLYDVQAVYMAAIIAGKSSDDTRVDCINGVIPYMIMEDIPIIVNGSGFTVNSGDDRIQIVHEAVGWIDGYKNGTYAMGTDIVHYLTLETTPIGSSYTTWKIVVGILITSLFIVTIIVVWVMKRKKIAAMAHENRLKFEAMETLDEASDDDNDSEDEQPL